MLPLMLRSLFVLLLALVDLSLTDNYKVGHYWDTKIYRENGFEITFHYRKLFEDEYKTAKSAQGFDPEVLSRPCKINNGAPPHVSMLDNSSAFRQFLTLPAFKPYLVQGKFPAKHGFYLAARLGTKAALWVHEGGLYRIEFWSRGSGVSGAGVRNSLDVSPRGGGSKQSVSVFPDDVVCVVRRRLPTTPQTTPAPSTTTSQPAVRCKPDALAGVRGNGTIRISIPGLDWFLIRHRYILLGVAVICLLALLVMVVTVGFIWWRIHVREQDTEKVRIPLSDPGVDNVDDASSEGLIKRPKVVHVPRQEPEFGAIAARRHRDMMRRSLANMAGAGESGSSGMPSPVLHYHTLGPRMALSNRPAVVTDCGLPDEDCRSRNSSFSVANSEMNSGAVAPRLHSFCTLPRSTTGPQLHNHRPAMHHQHPHLSNGPRTMV